MKKILTSTAIILLTSVFLLASSGFSLFNHHCSVSSNSITSILIEPDCLHHDSHESDCSGCCPVSEDSHQCNSQINHEISSNTDYDCCKTEETFFKIHKLYTFVDKVELSSPLRIIIGIISNTLSYNEIDRDWYYSDTPSPPRLYGKNLIFFLHQLKIHTS